MVLAASTEEALYLINILNDFLIPVKPIIFSDSQSTLSLIQNPVNHQRSKHIHIRYHFIREKLASGIIDYQYIPTDKNISDIMTKPS